MEEPVRVRPRSAAAVSTAQLDWEDHHGRGGGAAGRGEPSPRPAGSEAVGAAQAVIDPERLAVAINDAQVLGPEWWGKDLVPVAEKIIAKYNKAIEP